MSTKHAIRCRTAAAICAVAATVGAAPVRLGAADEPAPAAQARSQEPAAGGRRGGESRQDGPDTTDRETRVIPLGAAGFLELKTVSGDITVIAGGGRDVQLEIVRRARARSPEEARRMLDSVKVIVDHQGERATVTTAYPSERRSNVRVDVSYFVTAPVGTRIGASTVSGNLSVRDIKGELTAAVVSGSITISRAEQIASAKSISGDVTLTNTSSRAGVAVGTVSGRILVDELKAERLDVEAISGSVTARNVSTNRVNVRSLSGPVDFSGSLAKGGRYEFQSHSGDVRLTTDGAGFMLQATSFSGTIRPDPTVTLKSITATQRSLRGTVGDGSAVVVATTFSGDVSIGRR